MIRFLCAKGYSAVQIHNELCVDNEPAVTSEEILDDGVENLRTADKLVQRVVQQSFDLIDADATIGNYITL